jgi:ElaB/YqjD/DUF883 family membrane-anchored ribosome-binding protein
MSEYEKEVEKAKEELEQGLVPLEPVGDENLDDEYLGDLKMQAQEYGQKIQDAAGRARDFASEKMTQASEKLNELKDKDPKEVVEDVKEYARKNPGQTILISAAVGLVIGMIFRGRR